MPGIFYRPIDRRQFIATTGTAAASALAVISPTTGVRAADPESLHLALLSDTHIPEDPANEYRGFRPHANLKRIVPEVAAARPEGVIVNGDAARLTGQLGDYEQLKSLLAPLAEQAPIYIGLGNHDDRRHFLETFSAIPGQRQPVNGKHVVTIEHPAVRVVVLDSLLYVDKVAGLLGRTQRNWLAAYLAREDSRPVVFFVHHTLNDGDGDLLDVDRLFRLIEPHPEVKAIFYGHAHEYRFSNRQGVHLVNIPAVGYNFEDDDPVGWIDARFQRDGVALTLRAFGGNLDGNGKTTRLTWQV